jgi:glycine C-acetyltransferase/8-amino-7-oxononanoate synthase
MHIVPVIVGDERDTTSLCEAGLKRGVFAQAIRPPTVAAGTSRLRLAVMASHTAEELREAAHVIGAAARELGLGLKMSAPQATRTSGRPLEADTPQRRPVATLAPTVASSLSPSGHNSPAKAPFDGERDLVVHRAA